MEQQPSSLHPKVVEDILEFVHVIGGKTDDIARVLRLHALTEFFLDRIIRLRIPKDRRSRTMTDSAITTSFRS